MNGCSLEGSRDRGGTLASQTVSCARPPRDYRPRAHHIRTSVYRKSHPCYKQMRSFARYDGALAYMTWYRNFSALRHDFETDGRRNFPLTTSSSELFYITAGKGSCVQENFRVIHGTPKPSLLCVCKQTRSPSSQCCHYHPRKLSAAYLFFSHHPPIQGNKDKVTICNAGCYNTYSGRLSGEYYSQQICGPGSGSNEDTVR